MSVSLAAAAVLTLLFGLNTPGALAHAVRTSPTGNDVSYPQCGRTLPAGQAFGIVGVNDGVANTTNPCLATEITWAQGSTGTTVQPKASLYVNTANPGNLGVADWPTNNVDPVTGATDNDPYGACAGGDTAACAWQYGWNMADLDAQQRGVVNPAGYHWWLDVETNNSWETNTANNRADLEGMVAYFRGLGTAVGVYSTSSQWSKIAGTVSATSPLYTLPDWIPGARSLSGAQANCSSRPLTTGGIVTVTQWTSTVDGDVACR
ncbi:MAG TPA: hypothetical protein VFA78_06960 [Chloroflexota bacterium]|nr:hypothetical protein [Chloroflexota bacterium]